MKPTMGDRWCKYILRRGGDYSPRLCWCVALFFLCLAFFLSFGPVPEWVVVSCGPVAVIYTILGLLFWERNGFKRLVEAKEAEIWRLRVLSQEIQDQLSQHPVEEFSQHPAPSSAIKRLEVNIKK